MTSRIVITAMNMLWHATWCLLLVLRLFESWCEKKKLLPRSSCGYPRSCSFLQPHIVFFLSSQFHLYVAFASGGGGSYKIAWTALVVSPCDTALALLFGGKCKFISLRISWPKSLLGGEFHCWMGLFSLGGRTLQTTSLNFSPTICNITFLIQVTVF